jgi:hypothetical protein
MPAIVTNVARGSGAIVAKNYFTAFATENNAVRKKVDGIGSPGHRLGSVSATAIVKACYAI